LVINQKRDITSGEVRYATRTGVSPNTWSYTTLDKAENGIPVAGFDVAIAPEKSGIRMVWIAASASSVPVPNQIRSTFVGKTNDIATAITEGFGTPGAQITLENGELIFNCELRICSMNLTQPNNPIRLVTSTQTTEPGHGVWVTIDKKRFLLTAIDRKISFIVS
jgi:hypothetical protein